jgi:hypothetical protein
MGCLTAPFRLLGCLVVAAALAIGWFYRDRLVAEARRLLDGGRRGGAYSAPAEPTDRALGAAQSKVASLRRGRADSVVLSPAETASLVLASLGPGVEGRIDSVEARLGDGRVVLGGVVRTDRLPKDLLGPLALAVRDWERIALGGPVRVTGPRRGEWAIDELRIRDFPLPRDAVPKVLAKAFGDSTRRAVPLRLPAGVTRVRVTPRGIVLYGGSW